MTITYDNPLRLSDDEPIPFALTETAERTLVPTVEHLMGAPLQQLVNELHVGIEESSITDPGFTGAAIVAHGEVIVWLPANRSESERELMTRHLIGDAFRVGGMPPLPEPYRTTEFTNITTDVNRSAHSQARGGTA